MAAEFTWVVLQLDTKPQEGELKDVVVGVHWRRRAVDGEFIAEEGSVMICETPSSTDFTAYPDLKEEQVVSWLENGLDVKAIDEVLLDIIDAEKNPRKVVLPLPWLVEVEVIGRSNK